MAGLSLEHPWAFAFGLLGNIISFTSLLAPIPTFYRIYKSKSTEGFNRCPMSWRYSARCYGSSTRWSSLARASSSPSTPPAASSRLSTLSCTSSTPQGRPRSSRPRSSFSSTSPASGSSSSSPLSPSMARDASCRSAGSASASLSVSSLPPLSIIGRVIKTKSVEYMPFSLSLTLTLSAVVWFLYGLLIKDKYVALPNILGFTFGMIQMALYMFYMNATPVVSDLKEGKEGLKMPAEEHVVVINVGKIEKSSCAMVRPVTEMANAVPSRCAAEVAAPGQQVMVLDYTRSVEVV